MRLVEREYPVVQQIRRRDWHFGRIQLALRYLGIGINIGLQVDMAYRHLSVPLHWGRVAYCLEGWADIWNLALFLGYPRILLRASSSFPFQYSEYHVRQCP